MGFLFAGAVKAKMHYIYMIYIYMYMIYIYDIYDIYIYHIHIYIYIIYCGGNASTFEAIPAPRERWLERWLTYLVMSQDHQVTGSTEPMAGFWLTRVPRWGIVRNRSSHCVQK